MLATVVQFAGVHYFTKRGYGEEMHSLPESDEDEDEDEEEEALYQNYNSNTATQGITVSVARTISLFIVHRGLQ